MARSRNGIEISPDILLRAYSIGLFPMAESGATTATSSGSIPRSADCSRSTA